MLGRDGDVKIEWNPSKLDEVQIARKAFDEARKKGYRAYEVEAGGKGSKIEEFDADLGKIIMMTPVTGG